jgi:hypothetical protein
MSDRKARPPSQTGSLVTISSRIPRSQPSPARANKLFPQSRASMRHQFRASLTRKNRVGQDLFGRISSANKCVHIVRETRLDLQRSDVKTFRWRKIFPFTCRQFIFIRLISHQRRNYRRDIDNCFYCPPARQRWPIGADELSSWLRRTKSLVAPDWSSVCSSRCESAVDGR